MGSRLDRYVAVVYEVVTFVVTSAWLWELYPLAKQHSEDTWKYPCLVVWLPPLVVFVLADRLIALKSNRPGFWTRHRRG